MLDQLDKKPSQCGQTEPKPTLFQLFADKGFEAVRERLEREIRGPYDYCIAALEKQLNDRPVLYSEDEAMRRFKSRIVDLEKGIVDLEERNKLLSGTRYTEMRIEDLRNQLVASEECRHRQSGTITKYQQDFDHLKKTVDALR